MGMFLLSRVLLIGTIHYFISLTLRVIYGAEFINEDFDLFDALSYERM